MTSKFTMSVAVGVCIFVCGDFCQALGANLQKMFGNRIDADETERNKRIRAARKKRGDPARLWRGDTLSI